MYEDDRPAQAAVKRMTEEQALKRQVEQTRAVSNMLSGVCRGLHDSDLPLLVVVLGLADTLGHLAAMLVRRAHQEQGVTGATVAIAAIEAKLSDIRNRAMGMAERAPRIEKAGRN